MSYANLFAGKEVVAAPAVKTNLFGEAKKDDGLKDIEAWRAGKGVGTSAKRINFILNGMDVSKVLSSQVIEIGGHQVGEATEANRCVDVVVTEFADLKPYLDEPKTLILDAVSAIEGASKPQTFLSRLKRQEPTDWNDVRRKVKIKTDQALHSVQNCIRYRLDPFIEGLEMAKTTLKQIATDLDNTINALDYVIDRVQDPLIQDLARRRKEMFTKSLALMNMNKGQLDSMTLVCEKNKAFGIELEMTVLPVIENVMRSAVIDNVDGEKSLQDIASKLKGIL